MTKPTLGYIETVELPELGILCDAKVDTGACTSSLHAEHIDVFQKNNEEWVRFHVLFNQQAIRIDRLCEARILDRRIIASSNGQRSERYIIATTFTVRGHTWQAEISLSHRGSMKYPMLIGRKAIVDRFLVDVSKNYSGHTQ